MALIHRRDVTSKKVRTTVSSTGATTLSFVPSERVLCDVNSVNGDRVVPNPYSMSKQEVEYETGQQTAHNCYGGKYILTGNWGPLNQNSPTDLLFTGDLSGMLEYCTDSTYKKIRGQGNLAVDLIEGRKTLQMVRNVLSFKRVFGEFTRQVVRSKPYKRIKGKSESMNRKRINYVSSKWLEYRYGWMPLVNSTYDILDTLGAKHIMRGTRPVHTRAGRDGERTTITGKGTYNDPLVITTTEFSERVLFGAKFRLKPDARVEDWTSLNPIGIAWELVPLSFVVDWFVTIGKTLERWENYFLYKSQFDYGFYTHTQLRKTTRTRFGFTKGSYPTYSTGVYWNGDYGDKTLVAESAGVRKQTNRLKLTSMPRPGSLSINVKLNAKRYLDATALLSQAFNKFK